MIWNMYKFLDILNSYWKNSSKGFANFCILIVIDIFQSSKLLSIHSYIPTCNINNFKVEQVICVAW